MIVASVGEGDEELATGESVEVLGSVALYPFFVPDLAVLALSVDLGDDLVKIT